MLLSTVKRTLRSDVVQLVYHIWHCIPSHDGVGLLHGRSFGMPVSISSCLKTRRKIADENFGRPLKAFWEPLATYQYSCIDEGKLMLSFSVLTIFLDFIILFLPVPVVWSLQLPKKQRIAVLCIFGAGIIVCVAGIVHAYFVDQALVKTYDETWTG